MLWIGGYSALSPLKQLCGSDLLCWGCTNCLFKSSRVTDFSAASNHALLSKCNDYLIFLSSWDYRHDFFFFFSSVTGKFPHLLYLQPCTSGNAQTQSQKNVWMLYCRYWWSESGGKCERSCASPLEAAEGHSTKQTFCLFTDFNFHNLKR